MYGEASELDAAHPFVGQVRRAVEMATGEEPPVIGMSFTTDARFVRNQAGIPAVVCGPGDVELAHGNDEWVSVDRLVARDRRLRRAVRLLRRRGVTRGSAEIVVDPDELGALVCPRAGLVLEQQAGDGCFEQREGPLSSYRRAVSTETLPDGRVRVHQVVEFVLGVPYFSWLFVLPIRRALCTIRPDDHSPWWAPPQRMTRAGRGRAGHLGRPGRGGGLPRHAARPDHDLRGQGVRRRQGRPGRGPGRGPGQRRPGLRPDDHRRPPGPPPAHPDHRHGRRRS